MMSFSIVALKTCSPDKIQEAGILKNSVSTSGAIRRVAVQIPLPAVGGFAAGGLDVNNDDENENNGVGLSRKSCTFSLLNSKDLRGNGLDPSSNHFSNVFD